MRRIVIAAVTILLLAGVVTTAHAATPPDASSESNFLSQTNAARAGSGLAPLSVASDLVDLARRHSAEMADSNSLYHTPNLGDLVQNWQKIGENVGRGTDVTTIQNAFMASEHHRENILDPAFTQTGIGVVWQGDTLYVTVLFRKPATTYSAAAAPKPAAPTRTATPARTAAPKPAPVPVPAAAPAPVIPPAPYATEGLPTVDMPYFVTPPAPPSSGTLATQLLATSRHAPKHEHVSLFVQLMRLVAVAAVGLTAASWYRRRPLLRQQLSVSTLSA